MFDERRNRLTAGIDKSYLLEPIVVDTKTTSTKRIIAQPKQPHKMTNYSKVIVPPLQNRSINHDINGNGNFSISDDPLDRTFREANNKINGKAVKNESITTTKTTVTRKLTPVVSPSSFISQKVKINFYFISNGF